MAGRAVSYGCGSVIQREEGGDSVSRLMVGSKGIYLHHPFCFLLFYLFPNKDGLSAARCIRKLPSPAAQLPIFALTADIIPDAIRAAGMNGSLSKPLSWEKMKAVIVEVLQALESRGRYDW